jgi:hypothetical protein
MEIEMARQTALNQSQKTEKTYTDINGGTKMSLVLMMRSDHGIVASSDSRTSFQQYENYGIRNDQSKRIFKTDLRAWEQTT